MRSIAVACLGVFLATAAASAVEPVAITAEQRQMLQQITFKSCFEKAKMERAYIDLSRAKNIDAPKLYCDCTSEKFAANISAEEVHDFTVLGFMPNPLKERVRNYGDACMKKIGG